MQHADGRTESNHHNDVVCRTPMQPCKNHSSLAEPDGLQRHCNENLAFGPRSSGVLIRLLRLPLDHQRRPFGPADAQVVLIAQDAEGVLQRDADKGARESRALD